MLVDPLGAQKEVLNLASILGLEITVAVAYESSFKTQGSIYLCCLKIMIGLSTM
jgi:hypothetical protein